MKNVPQKSPWPSWRIVGYIEKCLPLRISVRYLLRPGELEGGNRRRATDAIWSPQTFTIESCTVKKNQPVQYWLENFPRRTFSHEELQVVPNNTQLPPESVLKPL